MKPNEFLKRNYDYLLIVLLYSGIFLTTLFKPIFLVDNIPLTNPIKHLVSVNFSSTLGSFLTIPLSLLNLQLLAFQILTLAAMLLSYSYIKKLAPKHSFLFAILFFFNPFVYSRIMVGQLGVLIAYLLLPVYIHYLFLYFETNLDKRSLLKLSIIFAIQGLFQPQFFVLNLILYLLASIFLIKNFSLKHYLKSSIILALLITLLSAFWLQGFFQNNIFSEITQTHAEFFSPKLTEGIPAIAKLFGMAGFWRESGYLSTYRAFPIYIWYALLFTLILLAIIGYHSNKTPKSRFFFAAWWLSILLAAGTSHPYTKPIFEFLFNNLPLFSGFRDSHKFIALTALSYSYLCYKGVIWLRKRVISLAGAQDS